MLRLLLTTLVPLFLFVACGGGGGGDDPDPGNGGNNNELDKMTACAAEAFASIAYLTDDLEALIAEINGVDRVEVTVWNVATGAYVLDADLNDDGFAETTVDGQVANDVGDYADGLQVGERIQASWNLIAGPTQGGGQFGYEELANNLRRLTGAGNVILVDGCTANLTNIDLTFSTQTSGPPTGSFSLEVSVDGTSFNGTVTMNGSIAEVSGDFEGVPVSFDIDTDDFTIVP